MVWQDIIVTIANILFSYSLIWQVYYGYKKKKALISLQSSFLTMIGLYALAVVYFSLNLIFSTITGLISGTLWLFLFIEGLIYEKA